MKDGIYVKRTPITPNQERTEEPVSVSSMSAGCNVNSNYLQTSKYSVVDDIIRVTIINSEAAISIKHKQLGL